MKRSDKLDAGKREVDADLVRRLVESQFPHFAHLDIQPLEEDGWDNWTFRLGTDLKVRLPTDAAYSGQAPKEFEWLPRLAPQLPLPIPRPVALGRPEPDYPWSWSLYEWIPGAPLRRADVLDHARLADDLAGFLQALWSLPTDGAPPAGAHNFHRGGDLIAVYGREAREAVAKLADRIDAEAALAVLDAAEAAPFAGRTCWVHGDISVGNLLMRDGHLSAVIDFGSSAVGDPACDLVVTWLFFEGESRDRFRRKVPADDACWARARAWALWKAAIVLAAGAPTHPEEFSPLEVIETVVREHQQSLA